MWDTAKKVKAGFNSLSTHQSHNVPPKGGQPPKWESLWYAYCTVRGFNSLLSHSPQVDRGNQKMTVMFGVLSNNEHRTYSILRVKSVSRHDTATVGYGQSCVISKGLVAPSPQMGKPIRTAETRWVRAPHFPFNSCL